jgi:hypothetical protein
MANIQVQLEDGTLAMCRVIERSFNHDVGERTAWVEHASGHQFMVVRRLGAWNAWTRRERVQPLIDGPQTGERWRRSSGS